LIFLEIVLYKFFSKIPTLFVAAMRKLLLPSFYGQGERPG